MFTGIVSAVGRVGAVAPHQLTVEHAATARRLKVGSSVAVNGCCLTVVRRRAASFTADVVPETLRRTNLGLLARGSHANLELPLSAGDSMDGHFVLGHVDVTARVRRVVVVEAGHEIEIELPSDLQPFVVEKGSIAVDGVSLTVAAVTRRGAAFRVALIPHTLAATIASGYEVGSIVNLEADVLARYVRSAR